MPSVRFTNLWEGFDSHENPLLSILRAAEPSEWEVVTSRRRTVDLQIGSVYPTRWHMATSLTRAVARKASISGPQDVRDAFSLSGSSRTARRGIWYTPENRRCPVEGWDGYLSYDTVQRKDSAYLPYWQLNTDLFGGSSPGALGEVMQIEALAQPREPTTVARPGFCCAILRNPDPVRLRAIKALSEVEHVDVYGPYSGRPVPSKREVMENYRFALAFENDLFPGYVTEKVFDAWYSGAVPIYWGLDQTGVINMDAVVDFTSMASEEELASSVADLNSRPSDLATMSSLPILAARPDPAPVLTLIRNVLAKMEEI